MHCVCMFVFVYVCECVRACIHTCIRTREEGGREMHIYNDKCFPIVDHIMRSLSLTVTPHISNQTMFTIPISSLCSNKTAANSVNNIVTSSKAHCSLINSLPGIT